MPHKNNAAGRHDTAANKTSDANHKPKTRMAMQCPCCGGEVTHQRYSFYVMVQSPPRMAKWYVCDECEAALIGSDDAARAATEERFIKYLEENGHALAA